MKERYKTYWAFAVVVIIIAALCIFGLYEFSLYKDSLQYIKYDEIQNHIEKEVGHKVTIQKHVKQKYDYYVFTYVTEDDKKHVGMSFYEQKTSERYERIGGSWGNETYGCFYEHDPASGFQEHFVFFGDNSDNQLSKIKLDFGDKVSTENVLNDKYYLLIYKFTDKDRFDPEVSFYDIKGNDISETIVKKEMEW